MPTKHSYERKQRAAMIPERLDVTHKPKKKDNMARSK